jgi:CubicO group peptidase (beta-lactamase class C family)
VTLAEAASARVEGYVAAGFEPVADAFRQNFAEGLELGAAFAAWRGEEPLLDIWAGTADASQSRPWREDTLQLIFSGSKGLTSICLLMLIDRGRLDLDAPVSAYWPEFGKPGIRVRDVVSHSARLPGIAAPVAMADIADDLLMARLLAEQEQSDDPRATLCYHPLTFGWLAGELIRRIDGRSVGRFFAEEIAGPLGLEIWFGLPEELEPRVARLEVDERWGASPMMREPPGITEDDDPLFRTIWWNPPMLARGGFPWNERYIHAAEIPGANAIGDARSIARLYAHLAAGGAPLMKPATVSLGSTALSDGYDAIFDNRRRNGVGFQLTTEDYALGPIEDAFGHSGAGGSVHGAWPSRGVGFSYAMNLLRDDPDGDQRPKRILAALAEALG